MHKIKTINHTVLIAILCMSIGTYTPAGEPPTTEDPAAATNRSKAITTIYLLVHPIGSWDRTSVRDEYMAKWKDLIAAEGGKEDHAIWIITSGEDSLALARFAQEHFGDRAFIDPSDDSPTTQILIAEDLQRTLSERGYIDGWAPYEMQANVLARKWAEGFKNEVRERGYSYDPETLQLIACGQQWIGCLTKYVVFMSVHLKLANPAEVRPDLSPYAGFPLRVTFRECVKMDRNVLLFLFETADHRPVAQFVDGLRAVWEPPHVAVVPLDANTVDILCTQPNAYQPATPYQTGSVNNDNLVVDVADGSRPVISTVVARNSDYSKFKAAMSKSKIVPLRYATKTYVPMGGVSDILDTPVNDPNAGR